MNALMEHMALTGLGLSESRKETDSTRAIERGTYRVVGNPHAHIYLRDHYGTLWDGPYTTKVENYLK